MKLLKKILPIATVASVAAIVTPFVTSCSNGIVASTSAFDYKPTIDPHTSGTIDYTNKAKVVELAKDYFSEPKHFAEDFCAMKAKSYLTLKEQLQNNYTDVAVSFNVAVKNVSFTEKTIKFLLPKATVEQDVTGFVANYDLVYSRHFTYTVENPTNETKTYTKYKYTVDTQETDSVRNAFLFWHGMESDITKPTIWGCFNDKASTDWEWRDSETYSEVEEWTYTDGTVIVDKDNASASDYYSKKVMDTPADSYEILNDTQLYYNYDDETWEAPTGIVEVKFGSQYLSGLKITY